MFEAVEHLSIQRGSQSYGNVTISLGVALFPEHGSTAEAVIRVADMALYRAKEDGRNKTCVTLSEQEQNGEQH